jgi:hypothetical protein
VNKIYPEFKKEPRAEITKQLRRYTKQHIAISIWRHRKAMKKQAQSAHRYDVVSPVAAIIAHIVASPCQGPQNRTEDAKPSRIQLASQSTEPTRFRASHHRIQLASQSTEPTRFRASHQTLSWTVPTFNDALPPNFDENGVYERRNVRGSSELGAVGGGPCVGQVDPLRVHHGRPK